MGAEGIAIAGANMWAHLLDDEPGHSTTVVQNQKLEKAAAAAAAAATADGIDEDEVGEVLPGASVCLGRRGAKPAKRDKKTKTKKKRRDNNKQVNGQKEKVTPATPPIELEEEMSEGEEEMAGEVANEGSRCRTVVSRIFRAAVAVAFLAMYCHLASHPSGA